MLTLWSDFDRAFLSMDELRRRMDQTFQEFDREFGLRSYASWPKTNLYDAGTHFLIRAEVPGLSEKDIQVTCNEEVLTIRGERKVDVPEGYSVHRQERGAYQFTRSYSLPCKIDMEKAEASVKDGVLSVRMAKAPESQPRQITVKAS
jgi:HSP20 family protein